MDRKLFISGIIIFAVSGFVFFAGHQGIQDTILKLTAFSPEKYQLYEMMESTGSVAAVIGILIALAGIIDKKS